MFCQGKSLFFSQINFVDVVVNTKWRRVSTGFSKILNYFCCYLFIYFVFFQPPKPAGKGKSPKSGKLSKAEKEKLKKEEAERKAKEEGKCDNAGVIVNPDPPSRDKVGISRGNVGDLRPYSSPRGQGHIALGSCPSPG